MVVSSSSWLAIVVTFFLATVLEHLSFPDFIVFLRPEWMILTLLYWLLRSPEKVGIFTGALTGLLLDVIHGSFLGVHMASMSVIAYLVLSLHKRIKMFPVWQQCFVVFFLVSIFLMISNGFRAALSDTSTGFQFLWLALGSAIFWPLVLMVNDRLSLALR